MMKGTVESILTGHSSIVHLLPPKIIACRARRILMDHPPTSSFYKRRKQTQKSQDCPKLKVAESS